MYENIIINEFNKHIVLTTEDIQKSNNNCLDRAIMNTELKRMCDKGEIYRIGRGVYTRCRNTKWGKILPAENDIIQEFYYTAGGYLSDVSYLNRIGITTQVPAVKYITANKFRHKLYVLNNTVIKKPKIEITQENCAYLQLLDGIETFLFNSIEYENPTLPFINEIFTQKLDILKLTVLAKRYYSKKVFEYIIKLEEQIYDDITFES